MDWTQHILLLFLITLTITALTVSQGDEQPGAAAFDVNNDNNNGNQEIDGGFTTPSTLPTTTAPSQAPATTPPEVNRTDIPTEKVVHFIPTVKPGGNIEKEEPTGIPLATNPPTKFPGKPGGKDDDDDDDENIITKDDDDTNGSRHIHQGGTLLAMSLTLGLILRQWTSV